jgi:hypothetical protein
LLQKIRSKRIRGKRGSKADMETRDQVKKLWGVDKNISFAKKTNADKWI